MGVWGVLWLWCFVNLIGGVLCLGLCGWLLICCGRLLCLMVLPLVLVCGCLIFLLAERLGWFVLLWLEVGVVVCDCGLQVVFCCLC